MTVASVAPRPRRPCLGGETEEVGARFQGGGWKGPWPFRKYLPQDCPSYLLRKAFLSQGAFLVRRRTRAWWFNNVDQCFERSRPIVSSTASYAFAGTRAARLYDVGLPDPGVAPRQIPRSFDCDCYSERGAFVKKQPMERNYRTVGDTMDAGLKA